MTVNLIAAVGRRGQIGRGAGLPWNQPDDLAWFKAQTMGGCIILGGRTFHEVRQLPGREMFKFDGAISPVDMLKSIRSAYSRKIWVAGGAWTYRQFAPLVNGLVLLSVIDYDSDPVDDHQHVFFPFDAYGMKWEADRG